MDRAMASGAMCAGSIPVWCIIFIFGGKMHYYIYCKENSISKYQQDAISEYTKRLSPYCDIHFIIDTKCTIPHNFSTSNHQVLYIDRSISTYSSISFAKHIEDIESGGKSNLHIYIGYTLNEMYEAYNNFENITYDVMSITNTNISNITLSILLYEQIYRGYTIIQGKTYHK